jgi:hypothetical protein
MIGAYSMGVWKVIFCSRSGLFQQNAAAQGWAQEKRATMFRFLNLKSENLSLRVLSGKQIDDLLDRSVGFFISGLEFTGGSVAWCGFTVEEAVG